MARRSQVPEFGNWDNGENIPYTIYFDNATKAKGNRLNPNDPLEGISGTVLPNYERPGTNEGVMVRKLTGSPLHRDAVASPIRGDNVVKPVENKGQGSSRSKHRQEMSSESDDGKMKKHPESPLHQKTPRRVSSDSPLHQRQGTNANPERTMRKSTGSDRRIENSPLHPHQQSRIGNKSAGVSSPSWERRGSSHGGSHGLGPSTPGRSSLPPVTRGNETPDQSTAVPRFGDWDESNPAAAENYTGIFSKVREERQSGEGSFPAANTNISHSNNQNGSADENSKRCCCFWWRK